MKNRTSGILGRLALVLGILGYYLLVSRIACYLIATTIHKPSAGWGSGVYYPATGEYYVVNKPSFFGDFGASMTTVDWVMGHLAGLVASIVIALLVAGLIALVSYIIEGPSEYVDPCKDPKCPCARHEEERQQKRDAETAMIAAGTAAAVSAAFISTT